MYNTLVYTGPGLLRHSVRFHTKSYTVDLGSALSLISLIDNNWVSSRSNCAYAFADPWLVGSQQTTQPTKPDFISLLSAMAGGLQPEQPSQSRTSIFSQVRALGCNFTRQLKGNLVNPCMCASLIR